MSNFRINFDQPWFLLLLIPAVVLTLLPYFRLAKRYRKTRNRIISIILHLIVMTMCITMFAGMTFDYTIPNRENEILFLVDASDSNDPNAAKKDRFIQSVIEECGEDYRVGIVTFGYNQVYAGKMDYDANKVFNEYLNAPKPDTSATDIAAALRYVQEQNLFLNKATSKIVLLSDGYETDGEVVKVIRSISAEKITVDTVNFPNDYSQPEVQFMGVTIPENISINTKFNMQITLQSNVSGTQDGFKITLIDKLDGTEVPSSKEYTLEEGIQTVEFEHTVSLPGMHELRFEVSYGDDNESRNNTYFTYVYFVDESRILIIEKDEGEASQLVGILEANGTNDVAHLSIEEDIGFFPKTLSELSNYDQIVFVNIAESDLQKVEGFDALVEDFVEILGGGLLTVGGNNDTDQDGEMVPHAYNRDDMVQSEIYKNLIPVQAINYTPPKAVIIVIDQSGSMNEEMTKAAKAAARNIVESPSAFSSRDYCGVITFQDDFKQEVKVLPLTQRNNILEVIDALPDKGSGGTSFEGAINAAGRALSVENNLNVSRRHIILITDGAPGDSLEVGENVYGDDILANKAKDITMSIAVISDAVDKEEELRKAVSEEYGNGKYYQVSSSSILETLYDDIMMETVSEIKYGQEFEIKINTVSNIVTNVIESDIPKITGYYGTRKKADAIVSLVSEYNVPIYAQWNYGRGKVGSFMCDLNGKWSADFISNSTGLTIINNIMSALMPSSPIQSNELDVSFTQDNYTTKMSVFHTVPLKEGETVEVAVTPLSSEAKTFYNGKTIEIKSMANQTQYEFDLTCSGLYEVIVNKKDAEGNIIADFNAYRTFSYSQEYNTFPDEEVEGAALMKLIAAYGKGVELKSANPTETFNGFVQTLDRTYNPKILFLILSIILLLLDIAVRKFKFKWPHELVKDYKVKKQLSQGKA